MIGPALDMALPMLESALSGRIQDLASLMRNEMLLMVIPEPRAKALLPQIADMIDSNLEFMEAIRKTVKDKSSQISVIVKNAFKNPKYTAEISPALKDPKFHQLVLDVKG